MKKDPRDRIPSSDLTAYERWELPLLDERGNEVWVRDDEMDLKPLTAEDLENIRREAMEDGAREGREKGYKEGFEMGRTEGHKTGHREGYEEGEQAGREAGRSASQAEVEAGLQRLQTLMAEMLDPLERHTENLETALLNLTLSLTRAVIHRELQLDSGQIRAVLKEAVAALPSHDEAIRIHVNPADVDWVKDVASRFEAGSRVVEDADILAGGCRVENRNSLVDFTVEKRFQKAVQKMLDRQLQGADKAEQGELGAMMGEMTDFHREVLESPSDQPGQSHAGTGGHEEAGDGADEPTPDNSTGETP
jgi:flagellar assembly protein FliH